MRSSTPTRARATACDAKNNVRRGARLDAIARASREAGARRRCATAGVRAETTSATVTTRATSARPRVREERARENTIDAMASAAATETAERTYALGDGKTTLRVETTTRAGRAIRAALALESNEDDDVDGFEFHFATRVVNGDGSWTMAPRGAARASTRVEDFGDGVAERVAFAADGTLTLEFDDGVDGWNDVACIVGIVVRGDFWAHAVEGDVEITTREAANGGDARDARDAADALARRVADLEGGSVNLFSRFCMVDDVLDAALAIGPEGAALVFAWLRLSSLKQLHWYAGNNYQGKDMASKQERLAGRIAHAATTTTDPVSRGLMRASLAFLPRGGGNGDDIRMGILNIMRQHGIREGHRPGIEDPFIAQWHQKLHSNTTPDDVKICEAYLHFLHTGNWDDFWAHLWDHGRLTRDDLADMKAGWRSDGIHGPALHMPHMIDSFKHYLWILKTTHGGGDVDTAMSFARHGLPGDLTWEVDDLLQNRDAWWVPGKIVEIRKRLLPVWRHDAPNRDVVMLDATLEKFFRTKVEAVNRSETSTDDLLSLLELSLTNIALTDESPRIKRALTFLRVAMGDAHGERWSESWSKTMDAALDFCALAMEADADFLCLSTQRAADVIASASTKTDPKYLMNFGEENVRSHGLFVVSQLLASLRPTIRAAAGRSPWQIASVGDASLETYAGVASVETLSEIQGEDYTCTPTVCLTETLGGLEDIPAGVRAVVTKAPVDLLSHIAIRARNTSVLLASVVDDDLWNEVLRFADSNVRLSIEGERLIVAEASVADAAASATTTATTTTVTIAPYAPSESWVLAPDSYSRDVVGGKSHSLAEMATELTGLNLENVDVPTSFALPFGTFERALERDNETRDALAVAVAAIDAATSPESRREALSNARDIIATRLVCPEELENALAAAAATLSATTDIASLWNAVCGVWASKWTERAWLSRKSCGIDDADLNVAVLLMELVDADLAFVAHTANPVTGDEDEIVGEICVGLGETLVGNDAGSALAFTVRKSTGDITVRSLPSKLCGHFAPEGGTVIARSDSNGEDLEDFAGAGLYDSITAAPTESRVVDYAQTPVVWNADARDALIRRVAEVASAVAASRGKPQDIEGAIAGDRIVLLQTRRQIC